MNCSKFIFYRFFILCLVSFCLSNENPFINQQPDNILYKVEVGINSISQISDDEYIISVYAINPYNPIAGIQFKIQPSDLFEVIEVYGGRSQEKDFEIHFNMYDKNYECKKCDGNLSFGALYFDTRSTQLYNETMPYSFCSQGMIQFGDNSSGSLKVDHNIQ